MDTFSPRVTLFIWSDVKHQERLLSIVKEVRVLCYVMDCKGQKSCPSGCSVHILGQRAQERLLSIATKYGAVRVNEAVVKGFVTCLYMVMTSSLQV
jgi:hypothetical protein